MPSKRFENLKSVKKRGFLSTAYKEFSLHSYEGASITRLVSDLKMAKGSIYQYFEDKEGLYNYLVEHAYNQLHQLLEKTCPAPSSSEDFDLWYKKFLMVYIKFLCAIPSYARLLERSKIDNINPIEYAGIDEMIAKASNNNMSVEHLYIRQSTPLILFNYIIQLENVDIDEIIISNRSIEMPSDKLLYLCEAFLNRN